MAPEAESGLRPASEIAKQFRVHPNQVTLRKKQLLSGAEQEFESAGSEMPPAAQALLASKYTALQ
ncbi:MAG: hypothetical protein KDA79_09305 [Planctomycetaceae bacterium]|nr:hypothetical protein [Planctomycetaceae bacterium]